MENKSGVTQSIIDELHSLDILGDQNKGESGVTRSIIDDPHSSDIELGEMEGEGGVSRSIIDELHSLDMVKWNKKVVLLEISLMKLYLMKSKEIK